MTDFHRHVTDYLQLRRSLGFKPGFCARVLPQLASYLEASGAPVLTAQLAISWAGLPQGRPADRPRSSPGGSARAGRLTCRPSTRHRDPPGRNLVGHRSPADPASVGAR